MCNVRNNMIADWFLSHENVNPLQNFQSNFANGKVIAINQYRHHSKIIKYISLYYHLSINIMKSYSRDDFVKMFL